MEQLPKLEVVAVNGVGTDAVDLAYARDRKIVVTAALARQVSGMRVGIIAKALQALGTGGYLINVARGKRVNEPDLVAALDAGLIAGAASELLGPEKLAVCQLPHLEPTLSHFS